MLNFSVFHRFYLQLSDFVVSLSCKYVRRDIYKNKKIDLYLFALNRINF